MVMSKGLEEDQAAVTVRPSDKVAETGQTDKIC